jgi:hypothetical protein
MQSAANTTQNESRVDNMRQGGAYAAQFSPMIAKQLVEDHGGKTVDHNMTKASTKSKEEYAN